MLGGQRDKGQAVGAGCWLAGDSRIGQARCDDRGYLQVPGRPGVIAGELAGLDPGLGHLAFEQKACLGAVVLALARERELLAGSPAEPPHRR
jgi:hypothetical protein